MTRIAIKRNVKDNKGRHDNVLLERMEKKIDHVLEGHAVLEKEIKDFRHETRVDIGFLKFSDRVFGDELKDIKTKIDRLEDKYDDDFKKIIEYLSRIDDEIQNIEKSVGGKADAKRVIVLEHHIGEIQLALEKKLGKGWSK